MIVNDFKIMIEKGLKSCPNDLESYLIRESKKAERDHFMTLESFVLLCRTAIEVDWEHTKNERLNDTLYLPYEFYEHIIEILEHLQNELNTLPPQPINNETDIEKYTAKHYLLAYLFECNAKGESFPIGNKKELERIGNERIGAGKGNRFYKVFNEVINKDLNAEKNLLEIGGENWRKAVIELSKAPELVEKYLQSKQL